MRSNVIILRAPSGISGDMLVTGLAKLAIPGELSLPDVLDNLGLSELAGSIVLREDKLNGISGWRAHVNLPVEHQHRTYDDISKIIEISKISTRSKKIALAAFEMLAEAESQVHLIAPEKVTFHEIGALDSILDVCAAASLYDGLEISEFFCSPLPLCDGTVSCEHGLLSTPAPAVLKLLNGVPVYGLDSTGETVTPTAIALLKAFGAKFGPWPEVTIQNAIHVYGGRTLPNVPNGATFVRGYI